MFCPFKTLFHTYTHTLPYIPGEFWLFIAYFTKNKHEKRLKLLDISDLKALNEWGLLAYLPSDHCSLLGTFSKVDPLKLV